MIALRRPKSTYFMLISMKYQLYKLVPIPKHLQNPGGPTLRIECVREMISTDYQTTSNKILYLGSKSAKKHRFILESTDGKTKDRKTMLFESNFKSRKFKAIRTFLPSTKIYDMIKISKKKLLIITMSEGVRVLILNLRNRALYEIKSFEDT